MLGLLSATGSGVVTDVKGRLPCYRQDWRDGFRGVGVR